MQFDFDFQLGDQMRSIQVAGTRMFSAWRRILTFGILASLFVISFALGAAAIFVAAAVMVATDLIPAHAMDVVIAWLPIPGMVMAWIAMLIVWPRVCMRISGFLSSVKDRSGERVTVTVEDAGLRWSGPGVKTEIDWAHIEKVVKTNDGVIFVYGLACCYIPLRAIGDSAQVDALLERVDGYRRATAV